MRSRVGIGAAALMGLCLTALSAAAQQGERPVTTTKDKGDTVKVTVSGNLDLDYVWRGREIVEFVAPVIPGSGGAATHAVNDFEGYAAVRVNAELSDKVSAMVELGSKRVDGGLVQFWGSASSFGTASFGQTLAIREAQVNVMDFLTQDLKLQFGITTWTFDLRGKGESMAFDLRHSQPITRNMAGAGMPLTTRETNGVLGNRAAAKDELEPVGLVLTYEREAVKVDLALLPAIVEGGFNNADEALYAIDFMYKLDSAGMKGSRFGAIIGLHQFTAPVAPPGGELMWTIGGGVDLMLMDKAVELYGEAYGQFGNVDKPVAGSKDKAAGYAFQVGADYHLPNSGNNLWGGINYTYYSGDKDTTANTKMDRFTAYEGVHDLMILEDQYTGFDWDSNYWALKLAGGFAMSLGSGKNNLEFSAIIGFARTAQTVSYTAAGLLATDTNTRKLGDEVDLKARWLLNKQASINIGVGLLFSSDVLKNEMLINGDNKDKTSSQMYTIGMDLKF